jgi:prepilin-type N-terminal cleavage/methylation domain-containing protein
MLKKENGFSLVEVIIGIALLGGLSLGFMRIFDNAFKNEANLVVKQESRGLFDEISLSFVNREGCGIPDITKLSPLDVKKTEEIELIDGLIGIHGKVLSSKASASYGRLELAGPILIGPLTNLAQLTDTKGNLNPNTKDQAGTYGQIGTSMNYTSEIRVRMKKPAGADSKRGIVMFRFPVVLTVDTANGNKITGCRSIAEVKHAQEACLSLDGGDDLTAVWQEDEYQCQIIVNKDEGADGSGGLCQTDDDCTGGSASNNYRTSVVLK